VLQQQGQLAESRSLIPLTERELSIFENRLSVLLGEAPLGLTHTADTSTFPLRILLPHAGIPAKLLLDRPDLKAKRAELLAADAEIGRAIADRLPRIILDGSSGYQAGSGGAGFIADIFSSFFQPLIDWGVRKAEVERNKALYQEKLFEFTELYLQAIEEVENALYQIEKQTEYVNRLNIHKSILDETLVETRRRYESGLTDYLPVLDALQALRRIERDILRQNRDLIGFYIDLFTSLGGGHIE
jgi:outer membrane protein TolC